MYQAVGQLCWWACHELWQSMVQKLIYVQGLQGMQDGKPGIASISHTSLVVTTARGPYRQTQL